MRLPLSDTAARMGRKLIYEKTLLRVPIGTLDRINAVLKAGEKLSDFLRAAVEAELARRRRAARKEPPAT